VSDTPRDPDQDDAATTRLPRTDRGGAPVFQPAGTSPQPADAPASSADPADAPASSADPADAPASGAADPVGAESFAPGRATSATAGSPSAAGDPSAAGGGAASGSGPASGSRSRVTVRARPAWWRRLAGSGTSDPRQRRRRQWFVAGISIGAALIVIALCAGALAVVDAVSDVRDSASDARENRALRDQNCLELERRLNRLIPPGSTATPAGRATTIRDENSAVRIYVDEISDARSQDAWRQILDARAVYADALDRQAKSRTPAFYVPPRNAGDAPLADDLIEWSPAACAGPIRRLAVPDL
jgi:hypothetical protein